MPAASPNSRASPFKSDTDREAERSEKRIALLRAAVHLFNERGFHATSLEEVAASLGVTKPVIYHYLGNKDQVAFECVRIGVEQLHAAAADAAAQPGTGLDRLRAFLLRYAAIMMDDFGRGVVRIGDDTLSVPMRARFRALKSEIDAALRAMIDAAVADGSARAADTRLAAFAIAGALNWPSHWHRQDGPQTVEQIAAGLVDFLCDGLSNPRR
ncbi:TetR/AcrR family transcriptional regulator [Sphingomonas immobilis]|uniref:TetR/AcrR family transcriptional regulator n=1 Tax=Sphingomonas immobilis TaxID=3063997 RepID=A0ABT8ZYN9_9SPHN|nr:TetR/AcrR family transcriptional regulator [Sphingomonas sp. CA1-15]MDO7842120.1 TetR/AcrR family transcriptional regulator [Sphingomonas sp. CA1-15]